MKSTGIEWDNDTIITVDEIKLILDTYRIGKKPLAKLLGWGETTIIRYIEGDIPTKEYSNKLKTILYDPEYYYGLLCKNRQQLTGVAYKKSKKAALTKIMTSKIYAAAYHMVNKRDAVICAIYIQYMLYYAQAFSLALYDKELFSEDYSVNNEQVPYLKLYEGMKRCGIHTLEVSDEFLSYDEREIVDAVMDHFSWYGHKALSALTAFERANMKMSRDKYNNKIISKETIKAYFTDIVTKYNIKGIKDIYKYPDQKIMEIKGVIE
jgi:uncharacterized phage-associated protein